MYLKRPYRIGSFFAKNIVKLQETIKQAKIAHDQSCRIILMPEEVKETESLQLEEEITDI